MSHYMILSIQVPKFLLIPMKFELLLTRLSLSIQKLRMNSTTTITKIRGLMLLDKDTMKSQTI